MAIKVINSVPTNSGIKPNVGGSPVGDHFMPVKKSSACTSRKKVKVSKATDAKIPMVVRIATAEDAISTPKVIFSKIFRALKFSVMRVKE